MPELSIPDLTGLSNSMTELQYWFTIAVYIICGIVIVIFLFTIWKILSCGVCMAKCVTCPCRYICSGKKKEIPSDKKNLLQYREEEKTTSLV